MHLTAICPVFRRPRLIPNILAMFIAQDYPPDQCRLMIYDDGHVFTPQVGGNWELIARPDRAPTRGAKLAELVELAMSRGTDAIVLFADDAGYLPGYLTAHAMGLEKASWTAPSHVLSDDGGDIRIREADRPYHGCWGYRVEAYLASDGYPDDNEAFDFKFGNSLLQVAGEPFKLFTPPDTIEYVHRRRTAAFRNGTAPGKTNHEAAVSDPPHEPSPGSLVPQLDDPSRQLYLDYQNSRNYFLKFSQPSMTKTGYLRRVAIDASSRKAEYIRNHLSEAKLEVLDPGEKPRLLFPAEYLDLLLDDDYTEAHVLYYEPSVPSETSEVAGDGRSEFETKDTIYLRENLRFRMVLENITSALLFYKLSIQRTAVQDVVNEFLELYRLTNDNGEELIRDINEFDDRFQYMEYIFKDS